MIVCMLALLGPATIPVLKCFPAKMFSSIEPKYGKKICVHHADSVLKEQHFSN